MPIDPSIALGVRPPQFESPLDSYGKVLSIRHMIQQGQLGNEQLKAAQTANEKNSLAMKDQELARQAWKENPTDPDQMLKRAKELGVGPDYITALEKHFTDVRKTNSEIADKDLTVKKYQNEQLAGLTSHALQLPDDQYAAAWPKLKQAALQINPKLQLPDQPLSKDDLDHFRLVFTTEGSMLAEAEEKRKQTGETRAAAGEQRAAALAPSLLSEAQSKASTAQLGNASQQLGAATDQAGYAAVWNQLPAGIATKFPPPAQFDPKTTPAQVRQLGMSSEQQTQAVQASANAAETAHQHQQTNTNEQARIRLEEAKNAREQAIYNQTYGEGANPALVGVPANLRTQALSQAQKAATEYLTGARVADDMESLIQMTRAGNKAAGSNLPLVGVETINALNGIKRINRSEIDQYAGAGSLLDKIQGKIGKLAVGQPIPKDVLDDIEKMHQTLRQNADKGYDDKLNGINQNYKSNFTRVKTSAAPAASSGGLSTGHQVGEVVNVGGRKVKITKILPGDKFEGDEVH